MKAKRILAIGIVALLVCGVWSATAQNQSEGMVASTSLSAVGRRTILTVLKTTVKT